MNKIILWTDGAATLNNKNGIFSKGKGGWAFIAIDEKDNIIYKDSEGLKETTNNECELLAIYKGLKYAKQFCPKEIIVNSDSAYCVNTFNRWAKTWEKNGWTRGKKHEPVKNLDLIKNIYQVTKEFKVIFRKVSGHSGIYYNEMVDKMAVQAKFNRQIK